MPDVTNEAVANESAEVAPKTAKPKKVVKKTKPAAKPAAKPEAKAAKKGDKAKAKPTKANKEKAPRADRVSQEEISNLILKYLSKQSKPVKKSQIASGTGLSELHPINKTCNKVLGPNLVKREAAKFHDMGRGYVFTLTANGKKAAAKIK